MKAFRKAQDRKQTNCLDNHMKKDMLIYGNEHKSCQFIQSFDSVVISLFLIYDDEH